MVTITNSSSVTFTFDEGSVNSVDVKKSAGLDESATPASDSEDAFVIDFNGVVKSITITGIIFTADSTRTSSGTTTSITDQIAWLEALIDGSQAGYSFSSTFQTTKTVYVRKFSYSEEQGVGVNSISFTLDMVEGA